VQYTPNLRNFNGVTTAEIFNQTGFDSQSNRKAIFNAGMIPNIKENPRNRQYTKRGRKRLFNAAIHALRDRVERTFAWEDKFKRLLLRFETECMHDLVIGLFINRYEFGRLWWRRGSPLSASSSAWASCRSAVSKPSVNQP
jgi:hypothetical protein